MPSPRYCSKSNGIVRFYPNRIDMLAKIRIHPNCIASWMEFECYWGQRIANSVPNFSDWSTVYPPTRLCMWTHAESFPALYVTNTHRTDRDESKRSAPEYSFRIGRIRRAIASASPQIVELQSETKKKQEKLYCFSHKICVVSISEFITVWSGKVRIVFTWIVCICNSAVRRNASVYLFSDMRIAMGECGMRCSVCVLLIRYQHSLFGRRR